MKDKLFMVELSSYAVVVAHSRKEALAKAYRDREIIMGHDPNPSKRIVEEIKWSRDLSKGWDNGCIPFGGDNKTTIAVLLQKK